MNVYGDQSIVSATFTYTPASGSGVTLSSATYRLLDEAGTELIAATALTPANNAVTVQIAAINNTLPQDAVRAGRAIEVTMTLSNGEKQYETFHYAVTREETLTIPDVSFQTYTEALMTAIDMPAMPGWDASTKDARRNALAEAAERLGRLRFVVEGTEIIAIRDMTLSDFNLLSASFIAALRKAQVMEANIILGGDPIEEHRRDGIMSKTVGESSQMFRPGTPLILAASARSMRYLTGYVRVGMSIGRA